MAEPQNLIDRSVKALFRQVPGAVLRLAGIEDGDGLVRAVDVSVNLAEHRADQVFVMGREEDPERRALHLEYQLSPDPRVLPGWFLKNAALTVHLGIPVVLVALYLRRAERASFPERYAAACGPLRNEFCFSSIRLWEHAERIRAGELPELAPLLVLCEDKPTEEVLHLERRLIMGLEVGPATRADLLSVAITVASRYFARDILLSLFREELEMLKEAGLIEEWLAEREALGEAQGESRAIRHATLRLLRERFGELPPEVVERVGKGEPGWCEDLMVRLLTAHSLAELGF